eukprot:448987_1
MNASIILSRFSDISKVQLTHLRIDASFGNKIDSTTLKHILQLTNLKTMDLKFDRYEINADIANNFDSIMQNAKQNKCLFPHLETLSINPEAATAIKPLFYHILSQSNPKLELSDGKSMDPMLFSLNDHINKNVIKQIVSNMRYFELFCYDWECARTVAKNIGEAFENVKHVVLETFSFILHVYSEDEDVSANGFHEVFRSVCKFAKKSKLDLVEIGLTGELCSKMGNELLSTCIKTKDYFTEIKIDFSYDLSEYSLIENYTNMMSLEKKFDPFVWSVETVKQMFANHIFPWICLMDNTTSPNLGEFGIEKLIVEFDVDSYWICDTYIESCGFDIYEDSDVANLRLESALKWINDSIYSIAREFVTELCQYKHIKYEVTYGDSPNGWTDEFLSMNITTYIQFSKRLASI